MSDDRTELEKRNVLRLSNEESNRITRECIQTALIHLMADRDISKISVSEIVKKAGVSRTAFYNNFTTKEDVLFTLAHDLLSDLNDMLLEAVKDGDSRKVFIRIFSRIREDAVHFSMAVQSGMPGRTFSNIRQFADEKYPEIQGTVRYLAFTWYGMIQNIVIDWFLNGMVETEEEMSSLCADLTGDLIARINRVDPTFIQRVYDIGRKG